jgi:hypothetical protein
VHDRRIRRIFTLIVATSVAASIILTPAGVAAAPIVVGPPPTALPDLTIVYAGSSNARKNETFEFRMQVKNIGGTATPIGKKVGFTAWLSNGFWIEQVTPPTGVTCQFANQGPTIPLGILPFADCSTNSPLLPGSDAKMSMRVSTPSQPGQYWFTVYADLAAEIHEAHENNNILNVSFIVQ